MQPSTRVSVSVSKGSKGKGGREKAVVVSEGNSGDMANRTMLGEHGAVEERPVVGMKRDGPEPERGRCGARPPAMHHRICGGAVIEINVGGLMCSVVGTLRVSARGRSEADSDAPGPELGGIKKPS